ncbi:hypothetical protein L207DRAFT_588917 [Hyaloscypha variabilis F]|uniref:Uncharacterized protein n=1 Tax=Hyaloscypha variabilis (strain UAMH 11265 / GT02V1 / F) TaxID=1149755 RepID=A0A2J6R727_HYAVF|nr:hypothetical protein L207DRAFT_588917 [Hyaloscypha variabilis F]
MYSTVVIQSKITVYTSLLHLIADKAKSLGIPFIGVQEVYNEAIAILRPDSFNCLSGFNLYQVEQQTRVVLFGHSDPFPGTVTPTDLRNNGRGMEGLRKKLRLQDLMVEKLEAMEKLKEEAEELKEELALNEAELGKLELEVAEIDAELKRQR